MTLLPKPARRGPKPRTRIRRSRLKRVPVALKRGKGIRQRSNSETAKLIRRADVAFSKAVREREPICAFCKTNATTDAAHHMPRTFVATRWWLSNASGLCRSCHRLMTVNPLAWLVWWRRKIGYRVAEDVEITARSGGSKRAAAEEFLAGAKKERS